MGNLPYKRICVECNSNFRSKGSLNKFCNRECKMKYNEKKYTYTNCKVCSSQFRLKVKTNTNDYCSRECYFTRVKSHPQEFGLIERAKKAREGWGEEAWKKGLETRTKNGNIIDDPTWKQYWKRCDWLTSRARKEMINDWDGYDYIDGEYIKENLNLHFTHGNYPTLDHIKPRSQCFIEGLTPREATDQLNLKWTKRSNNSAKNNKYNG
jgi:hypothetical protein